MCSHPPKFVLFATLIYGKEESIAYFDSYVLSKHTVILSTRSIICSQYSVTDSFVELVVAKCRLLYLSSAKPAVLVTLRKYEAL